MAGGTFDTTDVDPEIEPEPEPDIEPLTVTWI